MFGCVNESYLPNVLQPVQQITSPGGRNMAAMYSLVAAPTIKVTSAEAYVLPNLDRQNHLNSQP